ncbi:MAG TPA: quinone oxidoreductase [Gemmatimonadales bacterium]|nr:quinone oxidoreductase [Gemmatimonadales bacterium]
MRAIRIHTTGGPEVLRLEDIPAPDPKPGEVLVRVEAAGVNYIDTYQRSGQYRLSLPATLGQEGAGVVERPGPGVTKLQRGDRVAWTNVLGAYAEFAVVPAEKLVPLPSGVTTRQGAALMLQGMTAHYLACTTYPLKPGDTCLIHAAAGGVGLLLVQIAKRRGARVIGTVSTETKADLARGAGADAVILYTHQDFEAEVRRLTGGRGVEVVYDSVGRDTFDKSLNCLARRGMMVLFGQASGAVPPLDPQVLNQKGALYLTRPSLAYYVATREELLSRASDVMAWVSEGTLKLRIHAEYPLERTVDAHRDIQGRGTSGKLLIIP